MMNKLNLLAFGLMIFVSCNAPSKKTEEKAKNETVAVGADKDEHGCIASAGYTWSEIKKGCIQIFSEGFRLNPIQTEKGEEVVSAFVLMSEDQSKVEIFLPEDQQHTILLSKVADLMYENETYKYDANRSILYANGKEVYKGNVE
jgi:hypothetical protein